MIYYNVSKIYYMLFFVVLFVALLFVPNFLSKSASAAYVTGLQNTTLTAYYKIPIEPVEGFSNMTCNSGHDYVEMTGQYTAGNTSYKVIFLRMALLDSNGDIIATGTGHVYGVDAHKTTTFNAITRYDSTFSSCTIQIDSAIPK